MSFILDALKKSEAERQRQRAARMLAERVGGAYAYGIEFFIAAYSGNPYEQFVFINRAFGPYGWAYFIMFTCNAIIPQLFWFKKVRSTVGVVFLLSLLINVGMWFERFVIIVTSLSHEYEPFAWGVYRPSMVEMGILIGSFAWFGFWFLLFPRLLPAVAIAELKEVLPLPYRPRPQEGGAD